MSSDLTITPASGFLVIKRLSRATADMVVKGIVQSLPKDWSYNECMVGDIVYFQNIEATRLEEDFWYISDKAVIAFKKKEVSDEAVSIFG